MNVQVYTGVLTEEIADSVSTYFYDLLTTDIRRNRHIYPSGSAGALRIVNLPELFSRVGILSHRPFIYPRKLEPHGASELAESTHVPFTVYVVADLDSEAGLALVKEALDSIVSDLFTHLKDVLFLSACFYSARGLTGSGFFYS